MDFEADSAINEHNRSSEPVLTETGRMRKSAPSALESRHYNLSSSLIVPPASEVSVFVLVLSAQFMRVSGEEGAAGGRKAKLPPVLQ